MARSEGGSIVRHLRWLLSAEQFAGVSDGQLLDRFVSERDETAFAALVQRHGKLVLGACKRVLPDLQDAEDVFQATFVILSRKAGSIRVSSNAATIAEGAIRQMITAKLLKVALAVLRNLH